MLSLKEYFKIQGVNIDTVTIHVFTSGDDLSIVSNVPLKFNLLKDIIYKRFRVTLELENYSKPGDSSCVFLGSKWLDGKPIREEALMVASVIFGSGNFPQMSPNELLQSRFFEIFGNSSDCSKY